jgi:hypothetical protein
MNRDKELNDLINRLNRIFPHLEMINEGHYFADDNSYKKMHPGGLPSYVTESDFAPPMKLDWHDIIKELDKNGLEIKSKK